MNDTFVKFILAKIASGNQGKSAYQVAVDNGFVGTESQWLDFLHGPPGPPGDVSQHESTYNHSNIHVPGSDNQDLSGLAPLMHYHDYEPANSNIQTHVTSAHAAIVNWQSVYRTILDSSGSHTAAKVAGTYGIAQGNPLAVSGTGTLYALNTIYIDSNDYPAIDGKVCKLRVRCIIACNDVAPFTGTFKVGLHPVTRPATSGGAGVCIYTIGTVVTGSQVTGTNLAADSINNLVGSDFDLPANGFYVLAVITSATMATSSHVHVSASLQIRNN